MNSNINRLSFFVLIVFVIQMLFTGVGSADILNPLVFYPTSMVTASPDMSFIEGASTMKVYADVDNLPEGYSCYILFEGVQFKSDVTNTKDAKGYFTDIRPYVQIDKKPGIFFDLNKIYKYSTHLINENEKSPNPLLNDSNKYGQDKYFIIHSLDVSISNKTFNQNDEINLSSSISCNTNVNAVDGYKVYFKVEGENYGSKNDLIISQGTPATPSIQVTDMNFSFQQDYTYSVYIENENMPADQRLVKSKQGTFRVNIAPTETPTATPTETPTETPTVIPTETPTVIPTETPTIIPTIKPTIKPTATPTPVVVVPTVPPYHPPVIIIIPTAAPTIIVKPTLIPPTMKPTATPTPIEEPTPGPSDYPRIAFSDISGHYAEKYIIKLAAIDAVKGYPDGTFKPDAKLTRAEMCTIIGRILKIEPDEGIIMPFTDSYKVQDWARGYVAVLNKEGIALGYPDGTFKPTDNISREEMLAMIMRALKLGEQEDLTEISQKFADFIDIGNWCKQYVAKAASLTIINGYPPVGNSKAKFQPKKYVSRAEAVTMIAKAMGEE